MAAVNDTRLPLEPEGWFHIYNRGNEERLIFFQPENHRYFLEKYAVYMSAYWETYAYCLLPNHFHLAVQVKKVDAILEAALSDFKKVDVVFLKKALSDLPKLKDLAEQSPELDLLYFENIVNLFADQEQYRHYLATYIVSERFRHFLLGYAKAINKQQSRTGSLFQKLFRRRRIESEAYLATLICYIHRNPLHHGICENWSEYAWSSYRSFLSEQPTRLPRAKVLEWFGSKAQFEQTHLEYTGNWKAIARFLME